MIPRDGAGDEGGADPSVVGLGRLLLVLAALVGLILFALLTTLLPA